MRLPNIAVLPVLFLTLAMSLTGCNQGDRPTIVRASGKVTLNGAPVAGASVSFQPVGGGRPCGGVTNAQGIYEITSYEQNDGAPVGEHRVAIIKIAGEGARKPAEAASDHLVRAWHHTYGLPVVLTNCSNNYGPWQFPEKLIPVVILKALAGEPIPLYGDGMNVRDWLFVDDHVDALLLAASRGTLGESYCVGGGCIQSPTNIPSEQTNKQVVEMICTLLDQILPDRAPHARLITPVADRPGHDRRYSIDASKISRELGWAPAHDFQNGLETTVRWYVANQSWCQQVLQRASYTGERLGGVNRS